jgi:type II secretory pathway pseudopilin PulG
MQRMQGFTLVELILVIIFVAILAIGAMARSPHTTLTLAAQADQLASDIRAAQSLSMTRGQRVCLNLTAASYRLTNTNCTVTIAHPVTGLAAPIALGTNITAALTNLPNSYVEFDGRGQPFSLAGTTLLGAQGVVTLSANGQSRTVNITPQTGRVFVQ